MPLKHKYLLALLSLLFHFHSDIQAQGNTVLYSITEKDGLTDNSINCFLEDSRGVMWMGTNYGLNSFDGSVIKNYHHDINPASLAHEAVNDIKGVGPNTLWIATGNGLSRFDYHSNHFTNYFCDSTQEILNRYYSLAVSGNLLLLATEDGLQLFDTTTHKFSRYKNPVDANGNNRITKIFIDSKSRTWLCTYNGLWLFDLTKKTFTSYVNPGNDAQYDGLVNDILEDHTGNLWFGTWSKGLKKLNPETKSVESFLQYAGSSTNIISLTEQKTANGNYNLWVNSNLCKLDLSSHSFIPLVSAEKDKTMLSSASRIYCDSRNLLWISTAGGIKIYNPAKQYFNTTVLSGFVPLTSQGIALYPLRNQFLLGGEGGSSLLLFSDSARQLQNLSKRTNAGAPVMHIQKDTASNYWLCTSNGLVLLDSSFRQKNFFLHDDKDPASLPKNFLNSTLQLHNGEIWIMPWRKGIWRLDASTEKFYRVTTVKKDSLLAAGNISKVLEDSYGNCWITDYTGGLFKYTPSTGMTENIISSRRFTNEYIIGRLLWTVSSTEIFSVDVSKGTIDTFPVPPGKNKYEFDFIPDENGILWIATKTGLLAFNTSTKRFQQFTESDGLYNDVLDISFARLSNGNIIMAGGTYITSFSPSIAFHETTKPPLLFTAASTDGTIKDFSTNELQFEWDEKNITLSWALVHFSNPLANQYYYKLDGIDNSWRSSGNKGIAIFNSLEPGTYLFHYKAATSDGIMSDEKAITLVIAPPFWKTWLFRIPAIICLGFLFYKIVRYVSQRNLKEKVLRLEKEQAVEKERNRISRDMHDELGSGLTKIAILTEVIKTQQQSNEQIEKISSTARGLVDNLDEMVWALNPKNDSLDKLAAYIAEYTHQFMEGTGINSNIELPDAIMPLHISEEKRRNIFMVVKEFLNNTVKHSQAKNVFIVWQVNQAGFALTLKDDGAGFDKPLTTATGNGLKNMEQRIIDAGGESSLVSGPGGTSLQMFFH